MKIIFGITNGQVLQRLQSRGANVIIAGECLAIGTITATITFKNRSLKGWQERDVGHSDEGKFTVTLTNIPAGGPYRLTLKAGPEKVGVDSFYVGDVWLLAGQSNMQGAGNMNGAAIPHELVRLFSMRREWRQAIEPLHVLEESPDICHNGGRQFTVKESEKARRSVPKGVGPALFFAQDIFFRTRVPQGLIATAHGGTTMSQWSPKLPSKNGTSLYHSMISSVKATGQPISGLLWYQGESDANEAAAPLYTDAMKSLIKATRRDLRQPKLPWIITQIGRYASTESSRWWNTIQEYQRTLPKTILHLATVPSIDLELDDLIHISSGGCALLGKRMASAASRLVLRDRQELGQPQLRKIGRPVQTRYGWHLDVVFSNIDGSLRSGGQAKGFAFVDSDHNIRPTIYRIELRGSTVRLHLTGGVLEGLKLGYGMVHDPVCNIVDARGFSLPGFGPVTTPRALLPYVKKWRKTDLLPATAPLSHVPCLVLDKSNSTVATYEEIGGFINEGPIWNGKSGQAFFSMKLRLSQPMTLKFLIGYDGPIRIWVDEMPLFQDMNGTNPCIADAKSKTLQLAEGDHGVTVAMDTNSGKAWGFSLRFERMGLPRAACWQKKFAKPQYLT